jgi:hypothetical protein
MEMRLLMHLAQQQLRNKPVYSHTSQNGIKEQFKTPGHVGYPSTYMKCWPLEKA